MVELDDGLLKSGGGMSLTLRAGELLLMLEEGLGAAVDGLAGSLADALGTAVDGLVAAALDPGRLTTARGLDMSSCFLAVDFVRALVFLLEGRGATAGAGGEAKLG